MNNKLGASQDVLDIIKLNISSSEERRKQLRLEHNLAKLAQGDILILKSDEFIQGLVNFLSVYDEEKKDLKRKLLISLGEAVIIEDVNIRERTLAVLSVAGEHLLQSVDKGGILLVVHNFCKWLEYEKEILPGLVVVIRRMEELTLWLLENSFWKEAEKVITLFHLIQSEVLAKSTAFKRIVAQSLERFATKAVLIKLTDGYLKEDSQQQLFCNILLSLESHAAKYLLERCIQSQSRKERLALLYMLPMFGSSLLPILVESLKNDPPWTAVRNVLAILAEIGNDSCYSFIKDYFHHDDKRIQYEMICCVVKIGGCDLKNRLLDGLEQVHDDLKIYIIHLLVENAAKDEMVLAAIYNFLERRNTFSSRSKNKLISAAIAAVKNFPCIKSIEILRSLRGDYDKAPGAEQIKLQIEEAMQSMAPQLRHYRQRSDRSSETVSFDTDPQQLQNAFITLASIEEKLRKLVRAGDMVGAGRLLHEQALSAARARDFLLAEKLRDRLLEIDPMALAEAVALGDLIEEERTTSHTSHHLGVWSELYEEMTTREFNALYSVLRQETYGKDDIIVRAGEADDVLYFLNTGYISLNCSFGGNENFLKRMGPSSILGGDQFFATSVWTITLKALTDVHLQVLDHAAFVTIAENFPGIAEKLRQYCHKYAAVPELLKMSGDDRREYPRFPVMLFTQNKLLDPYGNKGKRRFKGELTDISRNGLAFIIKISSQNNAKLLLGRQIISELQMTDGKVMAECSGVIVGVRYHDEIAKDSTIHVKLSQKIDAEVFSRIIALRRY